MSYVYKIEALQRNFFDINRLMRLRHGVENLEHVAMGKIPWSQVHSYAELTMDQLEAAESSIMKAKDIKFKTTDQYTGVDRLGSLPRERLAGWPAEHPAWHRNPWKKLRDLNGSKPFN